MATMFENDRFENASLMLEVCRGVFERAGMKAEAKLLRGVEATSVDAMRACSAALAAVCAVNDEAEMSRVETMRVLDNAARRASIPPPG